MAYGNKPFDKYSLQLHTLRINEAIISKPKSHVKKKNQNFDIFIDFDKIKKYKGTKNELCFYLRSTIFTQKL